MKFPSALHSTAVTGALRAPKSISNEERIVQPCFWWDSLEPIIQLCYRLLAILDRRIKHSDRPIISACCYQFSTGCRCDCETVGDAVMCRISDEPFACGKIQRPTTNATLSWAGRISGIVPVVNRNSPVCKSLAINIPSAPTEYNTSGASIENRTSVTACL